MKKNKSGGARVDRSKGKDWGKGVRGFLYQIQPDIRTASVPMQQSAL